MDRLEPYLLWGNRIWGLKKYKIKTAKYVFQDNANLSQV